jgi:hypothetical protein
MRSEVETRHVFEFDEDYYLQQNPDVAQAVARGEWPSGYMHWCANGRASGRRAAPPIDVDWYISAYPQAARDIALGRTSCAEDHYFRLGRYRGYLPSRNARRARNPASCRSSFGGLWTDGGNAWDLIEGRAALGWLTGLQSKRLKEWVLDGCIVLEGAVDSPALDHAEAELTRIFAGDRPESCFAAPTAGTQWTREASKSACALDPHWYSPQIRTVLLAAPVLEFLSLLFERPVLLTHSLAQWQGLAQAPAQDAAAFGHSLPMQFVGACIALEDLGTEAGALQVYPGSQRFAEFKYASDCKSVADAGRLGAEAAALASEQTRHLDLIARQLQGMDIEPRPFQARRGDVLLWAADTVISHSEGGEWPTRRSLMAHYCPADVAPAYYESQGAIRQLRHSEGAFFSSGVYR